MSETRVVIPVDPRKPALFSYVFVWDEKLNKKSGKSEGYSMAVLWSKKDKATTKIVEEAIDAAIEKGNAGGFNGKTMSEKATAKYLDGDDYPIKDGDDRDDDSDIYAGKWVLNCRSKTKPNVVDADINDILDKKLLYSGCLGVVSVSFYPFNFEGKLGIGAGLNNIQVLKQGTALGADNKKPSDEFVRVDVDDEDDSPRRGRRSSRDDDDEDERPARNKKKPSRNDDDDFLD